MFKIVFVFSKLLIKSRTKFQFISTDYSQKKGTHFAVNTNSGASLHSIGYIKSISIWPTWRVTDVLALWGAQTGNLANEIRCVVEGYDVAVEEDG